MEEAFDEWHSGKEVNGYHLDFDAWAERDLRDMIEHADAKLYNVKAAHHAQATGE